MYDRKGEEDAEVRGEGLQPVPGMRKAEGLSQEVRDVQNLFQIAGAPGTDSRGDKVKLVEVNGC